MKTLLTSVVMVAALALSACSFGNAETDIRNVGGDNGPAILDEGTAIPDSPNLPNGENPPPTGEEPPPPPANHCDFGKSYTGFAGTVLEVGRVDHDLGMEQGRVKPFVALVTEYPRVLGNNPALLGTAASTFGSDPARWYTEPAANAVSIYTAYRIAFQGCLTATSTDAKWASVPSITTAQTECGAWARKFWSRTPTAAELGACQKVAMEDTLREGTNTNPDPRRRWAYACASVLTSAGFLTY